MGFERRNQIGKHAKLHVLRRLSARLAFPSAFGCCLYLSLWKRFIYMVEGDQSNFLLNFSFFFHFLLSLPPAPNYSTPQVQTVIESSLLCQTSFKYTSFSPSFFPFPSAVSKKSSFSVERLIFVVLDFCKIISAF